jgi:vacuolar-type H+-ATPase subunit I/STV1
MIKENTHRTIKLDHDVANIAAQLAKERRLSSVLSELLRKEYGVSFEDDLIKSQINELQRQKELLDNSLNDLQNQIKDKEEKKRKTILIEELEKELSLLKLKEKQEVDLILKKPIEAYNIETGGLEDWQISSKLGEHRRFERLEIQNKYRDRENEIRDKLQLLLNQ